MTVFPSKLIKGVSLAAFSGAASVAGTITGVSYLLENPKNVETVDGCAVPLRDFGGVLVVALEDRDYYILPDRRVLSVNVLNEDNFEKLSSETVFVSKDTDNVRGACSSYMSGATKGFEI